MRSRYFLASFVLALLLAGPASARGTLDSILPEIRAEHPGRLSDAQPYTDSEGRTHYRIKWMTPEGRILYFNADADTGRYSNSGGDEERGQWNGGGRRGRDDDGDNSQSDGDGGGGGRRSHWNGDGGGESGGGGRWNGGGGDGRGGHGGWRGGNGGNGDGDRGGWRGGRGGGERDGRHHGNDN